jgi:hypothetical protein
MELHRSGFVIYTAIANNYDYPRVVPSEFSGIDFICFCDNDTKTKATRLGWSVREFPVSNRDLTRLCRDIKLRPHLYLEEWRHSLWIDANIQITPDAITEINDLIVNDTLIATFQHPLRKNVAEEALECKKRGKDNPDAIDSIINFLEEQKYPITSNPLFETNVVYRQHSNDSVKLCMDVWWEILNRFSKRDQLSLGYALWKSGVPVTLLKGNARGGNQGYLIGSHRTKGLRNLILYLEVYSFKRPMNRVIFMVIKKLKKLISK